MRCLAWPALLSASLLATAGCATGRFHYSNDAVDASAATPEPIRHAGRHMVLPSGLRITAYQFPGLRDVSVSATYAAGWLNEPPGRPGLALVAQLSARRASPGRAGVRLAERVHAAGILEEEQLDPDEISFSYRCRTSNLAAVLAVESDRLEDPAAGLTDEDVAEAREAAARSLGRLAEGAGAGVPHVLASALAGTPYGRRPPTPTDVRAISAGDVRAYLRTHLVPSRLVLVVAGGADPLDAVRAVTGGLGRTATGDRGAPVGPHPGVGAVRTGLASAPALVRVAGSGRHPVLWLGWPLPGTAEGQEPSGEAAAAVLRAAFAWDRLDRAARKRLRSASVSYQAYDGAGLLAARLELTEEADPDQVRAAVTESVSDAATDWYSLGARVADAQLGAQRDRRYLAAADGAPEGAARSVRAAGAPDVLARLDGASAQQLGRSFGPWLKAHLARAPAAVLVERRPDGPAEGPPDLPLSTGGRWPTASTILDTAVPGAHAVGQLLEPPGLSAARRERLPNGIELVVLPRGETPFAWGYLVLRGGAIRLGELASASVALEIAHGGLRWAGCGAPTVRPLLDGATGFSIAPSVALPYLIESLACWGVALHHVPEAGSVGDWAAEASSLDGPVGALDEAFHGAFAGGQVLRGGEWARRYLARLLDPAGVTVVVAGKVDADETLRRLRVAFGWWAPSREVVPLPAPTPAPWPAARQVILLDAPGSETAWAYVSVRRRADPAQAVAWSVLEAHLEDRLGRILWPADVQSSVRAVAPSSGPLLFAHLQGPAAALPGAIKEALAELAHLGEPGPSAVEADRGRWRVAVDTAYALDTGGEAARGLALLAVSGWPDTAWDERGGALARTGPEQLREAAAGAALGREGIVISGDASTLLPGLRKLGLEPRVVSVPKAHGKGP